METEQESSSESAFQLSPEKASDIALFCSVAKANDADLSLREIIQLTSLDISEADLERAWRVNADLQSKYHIDSGMVYAKENATRKQIVDSERWTRIERATSNIAWAKKFAAYIKGNNSLVLSISGSTSYLSVARGDDLDFFCIERKDTVWRFLVKSLIKARIFRLAHEGSPWLCLSYVMDEEYAGSEFSSNKDGLFARDAISTIVVHGDKYYGSLLKKSAWMEQFFPKMYRSRIMSADDGVGSTKSGTFDRVLNYVLYLTAGTYIRIKSHLLNKKFERMGERSRLFKLRIGPDHCIYESRSYIQLRAMYSKLESTGRN